MNVGYQIEVDSLAIGLTKPAIKLGVPFTPFFLSIMTFFCGWMVYHALTASTGVTSVLIFFIAWFAVYSWMVLITRKDVFGLNIFWVNIRHFRQHQTFEFWGNTDSYRS